jgi:hypothetical protein
MVVRASSRRQSALLLLVAVLVLFASTAMVQQQRIARPPCSPPGRLFQRCTNLPVRGASLYWTNHAANAFRAPQATSGWVAGGVNTELASTMAGRSLFIASHSQGGKSAVSVLMTYLESTATTPSGSPCPLGRPPSTRAARTPSTRRWRCRGTARCTVAGKSRRAAWPRRTCGKSRGRWGIHTTASPRIFFPTRGMELRVVGDVFCQSYKKNSYE